MTPEISENLLRVVVQDHSFLQTHYRYVNSEMFSFKPHQVISKFVLKFFDKYKSTPSSTALRGFLEDYEKGASKELEDEIDILYSEKVSDISYYKNHVKDLYNQTKVTKALHRGMELVKSGKYDEIYKELRDAISNINSDDGLGDLFWKEKESILKSLDVKEDVIPTGFWEWDERLSGGAARKTENVIIAKPGGGKSTVLINIGKNAVMRKYKVVHYSLELSAKVMKRRYAMCLTGMSKTELRENKLKAYQRLTNYSKRVQDDSLIIKRYLAGSCSVPTIREHMNFIRNSRGFIPDVVIIDYADLMRPMKDRGDLRHEISDTYLGLRDLAEEFNIALWTASQTNRGGADKELISNEDFSEAYAKAAHADTVTSFNQNLTEKSQGLARLFQAKSRDDESGGVIHIKVDWSRARIESLD